MIFKRGITREVFIFWRLAWKVPSFRSWSLFLNGMLCNIREAQLWKATKNLGFCPVVFGPCCGFLTVMKKTIPLSETEWKSNKLSPSQIVGEKFVGFVEHKCCSYGVLGEKVVVVDYGS